MAMLSYADARGVIQFASSHEGKVWIKYTTDFEWWRRPHWIGYDAAFGRFDIDMAYLGAGVWYNTKRRDRI